MISWSGNNRTHMIRIPDPGRFELRLADGAVNPYLLPAAILAAGLDGIRNKRDPGRRLDINMYAEGRQSGRRQTPAAQSARRLARLRSQRGVGRRARKRFCRFLSEAQACRVEFLCPPPHRLGAADDARLLSGETGAAPIPSGRLARLPFETGAPAFREGRRRRDEGGFQAFSPSFSKSRLFLSKLFQRKLWRFYGISMGCKPSKPKVSLPKYFRDVRLLSAVFPTTLRPFRPSLAVSCSRACVCVAGMG